jgi:4-aminobutyrate aminotransferase
VESFKQGVLLLGAGQSSLRLAPPLTITQQQIDMGLEVFENSLSKLEKKQ